MLNRTLPMPDHNSWPAFVINGEDGSPGPTDISALLEAPAGKHGFISIKDGHLADGSGKRWRIWGANFSGRMNVPPMKLAPPLARHLAKNGLNCVRLHFMDIRYPNGILMRSKTSQVRKAGDLPQRPQDETTRALDPEGLTRLDYMIACLKQHGVYVDINLNVARPFTEADGVTEAEWLGYGKALTYFDERLIELQKEYARQLLEHVNPFTGLAYKDEPAVALVELVNENSILESWLSNHLRGENRQPTGTWSDIPPYYGKKLDELWNHWLQGRFSGREALAQAWEGKLDAGEDPAQGSVRRLRVEDFAQTSRARFTEEAEFYASLERNYFAEMSRFLQEEVGVKQVILGSSDHNMGKNNVLHLENLATLGITDGHFYWEHPEFPGKDWSRKDWYIVNTAMVDAADRNVISRVARSKVKGMPYLVSETNAPFPNDFASGFIPILAGYGAFQDWDGLFPYDYNHTDEDDKLIEGFIHEFFAVGADPLKRAESLAAGLAFLRGDVQKARQVVGRRVTREQMVAAQLVPLKDHPFWVDYLPGRLALMHGLEVEAFNAVENHPAPGSISFPEEEIRADTGEIVWHLGAEGGRVLFDTPRWQTLIGRAGKMETANLALELSTPYAAVQAVSLDGKPLAEAERILLVVAARVANTGMVWTGANRQSIGEDFGEAPTRIEPVTGTLALRKLGQVRGVTVQSLDGSGQPFGEPLQATASGPEAVIDLGALGASPWHLVTIAR